MGSPPISNPSNIQEYLFEKLLQLKSCPKIIFFCISGTYTNLHQAYVYTLCLRTHEHISKLTILIKAQVDQQLQSKAFSASASKAKQQNQGKSEATR